MSLQSVFLVVFFVVPTIPEFHNYYMPVDDTKNSSDSELSVAGRHSRLFHNLTERCGINSTHCLPGLSLAMWMKSDTPRNDKLPSEFTSAQGISLFLMVLQSFTPDIFKSSPPSP
jgi:hypothetical protein